MDGLANSLEDNSLEHTLGRPIDTEIFASRLVAKPQNFYRIWKTVTQYW